MAKKSIIRRNLKRIRIVESVRASRRKLKDTILKDESGREDAILKLQKRRRDESPSRIRERCRLCGRSNGTFKKFGLCRIHLREAAMRGDVPGLKKASW